jgi:hypothetical protein
VVETSSHPLSEGMEVLAICLPEEVLCDVFLKGTMLKSSNQQRSLCTLAQHIMAQLPSSQEPYAVKLVLKGRYQYDFD